MVCDNCGKEVREGVRYCTNCGRPLDPRMGLEKKRMHTPKTGILMLVATIVLAVLLFLWMLLAQRVQEEGIEISIPEIFALAIVPALILIIDVWRLDKQEKEPFSLLFRLFLFGGLTVIPAFYAEQYGGGLLSGFLEDQPEMVQTLVFYGLLVSIVEEVLKFIVLKHTSWWHPAYNFRYDGMVYGVIVSLGFAAVENINYVWSSGLAVGLLRAVTTIAMHCITGVVMGYFYGLAKQKEGEHHGFGKTRCLLLALLVPILMHGVYDFIAAQQELAWQVLFFIMIAGYEVVGIRMVRRASKADVQIVQGK